MLLQRCIKINQYVEKQGCTVTIEKQFSQTTKVTNDVFYGLGGKVTQDRFDVSLKIL